MITYEYVGFCMWEKPKFSRYTWPYQSYHVVFWQADQSQPWLRLFKVTKLHWDVVGRVWAAMQKNSRFFCGEVSVFHHGLTHFFATHGIGADTERARWVADAPCHWLQGYIRYIEQACSSLTELCSVWTIPIPFYFFYLFLGLDVLSFVIFNNLIPEFWPI